MNCPHSEWDLGADSPQPIRSKGSSAMAAMHMGRVAPKQKGALADALE
jgi:hypothetical protein